MFQSLYSHYQSNNNIDKSNINCDLYSLLEDNIELVSQVSSPRSEVSSVVVTSPYNKATSLNQLLSDDAKLTYSNHLSIATSTISISSNVPVNYINDNTLLYNFDKEDLTIIDLYSAKLSNSSNIILSETDIEFLKQNMESPVYNFTLLVVSFVTVNSYFKSEHCAKSNLYFSHINYLFHYFSLQSIQSSLTDTNKYYLEIAYTLLNNYFNTQH
ncbi:hypothetical protein K502DRAFT_367308 [Neoconidiobolus thromboides FSU 785]|nr:hypothetical protein K502DRAFT_367308 [Neoconidiobolus thromboides FSU 785]